MASKEPPSETPGTPCAAPAGVSAHAAPGHTAHHVSEFGEVENLVHIEGPPRPSVDDALPAPPISRRDKMATKERCKRLHHKCFQPRHIHQYWCHESLYRTHGSRSIGSDELFLDLVIVGGLAAIGHELRESYRGWSDVEKFILLFGAIYSSWRNAVFLWNVWGVASDLTDKIGIYIIFTSLSAIALGAHGAFDDGVRPYVAVASFVASTVPALTNCVWSRTEPLLHNPGEVISYLTLFGIVNAFASSPYLAAAFVSTERTTRILYWIALLFNLLSLHCARILFEVLHTRRKKPITRIAVNIELMVEKYDILTMIVLGESVIGLLFEAARVVTKDDVKLSTLYGSAAAATAMLYSLQTLYINVDSPIAKGGKHAIRYKKILALLWGQLHFPYHAALVLFATGLGLAIHDIALPPSETAVGEAADHAVNALADVLRANDAAESVIHFGLEQRWLFSVGWGASILGSGIIGALHYAGPRAATKRYRFLIRAVVVIAVMVGMPFSDLAANYYLAIHAVVLIVIALVEYIFVQMDKMGFFRSEATMFSSSADGLEKMDIDFGDDRDEGDDSNESPDHQSDDEHVEGVVNTVAAEDGHENLAQAFQDRLCRSHTKRLVPLSKSKSMRESGGGGYHPHV